MKESLTQAVMTFKKTGEKWDSLLNRISLILYKYPVKHKNWDEDKCSEFYLQFYPKIPGIVQRYKPRYRFETYLSSSIEWYMKTFTEKQAKKEQYDNWTREIAEENFLEKTSLPGDKPMSYCDRQEANLLEFPENCPFELEENGRLEDPALRRRILYAVLLRAADMDFHRIPVIATLVDVDADWLFERTRIAENLVSEKIKRRDKLRNRRNEYWYQLNGARKRSLEACDSGHQNQWARKADEWKNRYISVSRSISSLSVTTAHRDIARMLDTPPGTISSGLYLLRKRWNAMKAAEDWTSEGNSG